MPPENQNAPEELFRELETQLAALRATAKSLRDEKPSWSDNTFHPGRRARREADFSVSLGATLRDFCTAVRQALGHQQWKIAELEREISGLRDNPRALEELRGQQQQLREQHAVLAKEQTETRNRDVERQERTTELQERTTTLQERAAKLQDELQKQAATFQTRVSELQQRLEDVGKDYAAKIEQLASGQANLTNEFRERLQSVLDEQRVSIRQLALKASEDAVLSDRARRAAELKLEELAKRLPPA